MTKTVIIPDDIHLLIVKKQVDIREKYGINLRITDMLVAYVKVGLARTEELLNITAYTSNVNSGKGRHKKISLIEEGIKKISLVEEGIKE